MIRVEVKNFQSIKEETVDIDGFSVVVGRSNIGKSALVRAIKAALTGAPVDSYVRHSPDCPRIQKGAKSCKCFCSVRIQGPGLDLLWEKGDSVNRYVHNGTEHTVVGKGTPEFLGPGFQPIHIGGDTTPTLLQVADQFRPLFILDRSGTAVADVLSDVAKLDQINEASRAAERDKRECSSTRKVREKDLKELDRTLDLYDGLDDVVARVSKVEAMAQSVAASESRLNTVDHFANTFVSIARAIRALQPIEKILIPSPEELLRLYAQATSLSKWCDARQSKTLVIEGLEKRASVAAPSIDRMIALGANHMRLCRWVEQFAVIKASFERFKAVESTSIPDVSSTVSLQSKYRELATWSEKFSGLQVAIERLQKASASAEAEEAALLAEFETLKVCPTCRQPVQISAHSHEGEAA